MANNLFTTNTIDLESERPNLPEAYLGWLLVGHINMTVDTRRDHGACPSQM